MDEGKTYIAFYESTESFIHRIYDAIFYEIDFGQITSLDISALDVYLKKIPRFFFPITMKDGLDLRQNPSFPPTIEPFLFRFFQGTQLFEFHSGHYAQYPTLDSQRHGCWNTVESRSVSTSYLGRNKNETDFTLQDLITFTQAKRIIKQVYIPQSLSSIYEILSKRSKSFECTTLYYYLWATYILYQESSVQQSQFQKVDILCLSSSPHKCQLRVFDPIGNEVARYGFDFEEKKKVFVAEKSTAMDKNPINPLCELQCYYKVEVPYRLHIRSFLLTEEYYAKFYFKDSEISTLYDIDSSDELTRSVIKQISSEPLRFSSLASSSPSFFTLSKTNQTLEITTMYMSRSQDFIQRQVQYFEDCKDKISTREKTKIMYFLGMYLLHNQVKVNVV